MCADLRNLRQAIMSLRAFEDFAPSVRQVTEWSGITDVDRQHVGIQEPCAAVRFSWEGAVSSVVGEPGLPTALLDQVRLALQLP